MNAVRRHPIVAVVMGFAVAIGFTSVNSFQSNQERGCTKTVLESVAYLGEHDESDRAFDDLRHELGTREYRAVVEANDLANEWYAQYAVGEISEQEFKNSLTSFARDQCEG